MSGTTPKALLFACLSLLAAAPASAQSARSLDVERFRPSPDRDGFIGIPGTATPGPWAWNTALFLNYSSEPLTVHRLDDGTTLPIIEHRVGADFVAQLGILGRLAVVVNVPVILWQETDSEPLDAGPGIAAVAFRDPYVGARVRILGQEATGEHGRAEGEGLALQAGVTLPFGLEESFAGEGAPSIDAMVLGDFHFLDFGIGGVVGYRHRFAEPSLLGVRFRNELFFGVALQTPTFILENTSVIFEVRVTTALDDEAFLNASTASEGELGVRWAEGDIALTWAVGMGFNGGVGVPSFRGLFGVEFAPRTHDMDGDGIVDDADQCERLPEDIDEFEDEDGCPEPDNDGDLIPDEDDRCPNEAADFERDEDEDGCTDPVRDRDSDGIEDSVDECPRQPEDLDDFEDDDGCPDLDDDADGILDGDDRCQREPEDEDGFQDDDGCPEPDNDGDAVPDAEDGCPLQPEDLDGHEDADGCPDLDNDRDGVQDTEDRCPTELETINGVDDGDGCPDRGGRALWRAVPSEHTQPTLSGRLGFAPDGTVRTQSSGSLDQLARHLVARCASPRGARWTLALAADSQAARSAASVAMTERGVPPACFEVVSDPALSGQAVTVRPTPAVDDRPAPADSDTREGDTSEEAPR